VYAYEGEIDAWLRKIADHGTPASQDDRHSRVARPEKAHAEEPSERAAPQGTSVSIDTCETPVPRHAGEWAAPQGGGLSPVVDPNALAPSPSSRRGTGHTLWAVFLGGAILIAVAAAAWLRAPASEPKVLRFEQLTNDGFEKHSDLVTDGARVYFIENSRDGRVVAEIPSTGGNPVAIARADRDSAIQDISPDRTELLLIQETGLRPGSVWILSLLVGSRRRLGAIQAFSAAWSPDGAALAYTTDDGLYLCDANGSNSRRIVAMSGKLEGIHWSPGGRHLCLRRFSSKEATLWEVDRDGKGLRRLVPDWDMPYEEPSSFWTPDGKYLILPGFYASHKAPWALRVSAGLLERNEQVTRLGPAGVDLCPATMSPDRSRLYCIGWARVRFQIERFDARSRQFVACPPDVPAYQLDFTKDGQWVAYEDDKGWLWKSRNGGGEKVQLTLPPLEVEMPRWSPDGKWIAFMGRDQGKPWKVRLVSAKGGPYGPVTSTDATEGAPTWSPDGSRLAFGGLVHPGTRTPGPLLIHLFDLKERHLSVVPGSEGLWTARWSPDGRYIAALTEDSCSLMLFDFRAGKWTKLLTLDQILDLHWSRQGKSIYLTAEPPEGERALFRVKIPGHQAERLAGMGNATLSGWLGLAPDDSPLVTRELSGEEIYALECQFP
jgi:Tol biopolymer transport system component